MGGTWERFSPLAAIGGMQDAAGGEGQVHALRLGAPVEPDRSPTLDRDVGVVIGARVERTFPDQFLVHVDRVQGLHRPQGQAPREGGIVVVAYPCRQPRLGGPELLA